MPGLIERYRDQLPFAPEDPVVSLQEGSTPLVPAPQLSERVGAQVWLKIEGANPTGSFKDRGMTCAVSAAVREGADGRHLRLDRQHRGQRGGLRRARRITGAVIVPEGKIATGKLAQALMHGARVIALRGNFDEALELVRELSANHPIALVNSVNPFRLEGQKTAAFEILDEIGPIDALCIPVGNAGQHHRLLEGLPGDGLGTADARLPGRGRRAARHRPARRDIRRPSPAPSASATRPAGRRR